MENMIELTSSRFICILSAALLFTMKGFSNSSVIVSTVIAILQKKVIFYAMYQFMTVKDFG